MNTLALYRKRLIPQECILLKDDVILEENDSYILTKWHTLKPKKDLDHGYSCCYLDLGIKVSKFLRKDDSLIYWYCDIVDYDWKNEHSTLITTDLLIDILIYPDHSLKVLDLDELADAEDQHLISSDLLKKGLRRANSLLTDIYAGNFDQYKRIIESHLS
jgi:predicted RNA-binding protein associated with RNAse of E/G family